MCVKTLNYSDESNTYLMYFKGLAHFGTLYVWHCTTYWKNKSQDANLLFAHSANNLVICAKMN